MEDRIERNDDGGNESSLPAGRHRDRVLIPQCQVLVVKVPQSRNPIDGHSRVKRGIARVFRKCIQVTGSEQCVIRSEENEIKRITEKYSHEYSPSEPRFGRRMLWSCAHSTFRMLSGSNLLQDLRLRKILAPG